MDVKDRDYMITAGELSSILAHEIKNPMNSIIINMEVLKSSIIEITKNEPSPASDKAKKYLDVIEGEIRRLDKVIKGFLEFASQPNLTKIKFKLNPLLQNVVEFMRLELEQQKISVELSLHSEMPSVQGSPDQIKQAVINLVLNAAQALPKGGKIVLATSAEGDKARIHVKDNGVGIDKSIRDKIFSPYFTTKAKGSGLGLTIVHRVVKDHGGEIQLESEPGKGTEFILVLPAVASK